MDEEGGSYYRLCVVRRAGVADPADLERPLETLVRALAREDPRLFALSGLSPARQTTRVLGGGGSMVPAFLSTSEIEWNFGRDPGQPTHEILFFNDEDGNPRTVVLRVSFVACGAEATCPGLVAELILGSDAAGPPDAGRGVRLDKLLSILLDALLPDFGHVELPGHPDSKPLPEVYDVGWITYFGRSERPPPSVIDPPAAIVVTQHGTKVFAAPALATERYSDLAGAIAAVRERLAGDGRACDT